MRFTSGVWTQIYCAFLPKNSWYNTCFVYILSGETRKVCSDLPFFSPLAVLPQVMHPHLKLVLMSATLCVDTYRKYFNVEEDAIFVGVKRFPLTEYHLGDIAQSKAFPRMIQSRAQKLIQRMQNVRVDDKVNKTVSEHQVKIAVDIAKAVAEPGRSVLIFVAGIYTIGQIAEEFDDCPGQIVLCR